MFTGRKGKKNAKAKTMMFTKSSAVLLLVSAAAVAASGLDRRDGSTITVSTTQFNPAETNQGGTTNSAGTFNVSPLATSSSYQFQTLSQTSTFSLGAVNTGSPSSGNSGGSGGGSGGSGGGSGSGGSGNIGGGTVVVTATASTRTVNSGGGASATNTGSASASGGGNGQPTLALGASSASNAGSRSIDVAGYAAVAAVLVSCVWGAFVVA